MDEQLLEQLQEIYTPSLKIEGDKEKAKILLKMLVIKHGINLGDNVSDVSNLEFFEYSCEESQYLLTQIIEKVLNDNRAIHIYIKINSMAVTTTKYEMLQIEWLYEWHWGQYLKEKQRMIKELYAADAVEQEIGQEQAARIPTARIPTINELRRKRELKQKWQEM